MVFCRSMTQECWPGVLGVAPLVLQVPTRCLTWMDDSSDTPLMSMVAVMGWLRVLTDLASTVRPPHPSVAFGTAAALSS